MAKISLSKAFILRKRLRGIIASLTDVLKTQGCVYYFVSKEYPDGQIIESSEKPFEYKGMDLEQTFSLFEEANAKIVILNNLIDVANVEESRKVINELEAEKNKIGIIRQFAKERKSFIETVSTYKEGFFKDEKGSKGGIIKENFKLTNNQDWDGLLEETRKKIMKLEDKLSEVNATTLFEVPNEVINFISNNA